MLLNPLYAGFICTKYTDDKYVQGMHEPIIDLLTHYKLKSAVDRQYRRLNKSNSDNYPMRGGFLRCNYCQNAITGNAPKGRGGKYYPRYSCTKCRKYTGAPATSKNRDVVHEEFLALSKSVKPKEGVTKLFKEVVLTNWNAEFKHAANYAQTLEKEFAALQNRKSKIIDLFVEGRLTDAEKENKLDDVDKQITQIELKRVNAGEDVKDKEQVVDAAIMLLSHLEDFWNLGSLEVKKQLQELIFPEGINYDFSAGFGTTKLNNSYLLMKNIGLSADKNQNLVAGAGLEPATLWL